MIPWYEIVYSICVGTFFAGLVLTVLLIILSGSNLISHSDSSDINADDIDADIDDSSFESLGHGDADFDTPSDGEIDLTSQSLDEISHDTLGEIHDDMGSDMGNLDTGNLDDIVYTSNVPLSLSMSLLLLWFGAIGLITFNFLQIKWIWVSLTILLTVGIHRILIKIWGKIAQNWQYRLYSKKELLGEQATIKVDTSNDGGVISIKTKIGIEQLHAKTLHPLAYYYSGDVVYIVDYAQGIYYVDADPENIVHQYPKKRSSAANFFT